MELLLEDPTYLAGGLGILGVAFLIAVRVTQQGRYLIWALIALALAGAAARDRAFLGHRRRADRARGLRPPGCGEGFGRRAAAVPPDPGRRVRPAGAHASSGEATRDYIRSTLTNTTFDFVRISHLKAKASPPVAAGERRVPDHRRRQHAVADGDVQLRHDQLRLVARLRGDQPRRLEGEPDLPDPSPCRNAPSWRLGRLRVS